VAHKRITLVTREEKGRKIIDWPSPSWWYIYVSVTKRDAIDITRIKEELNRMDIHSPG